jgi:uncharacterized protein DUF3352
LRNKQTLIALFVIPAVITAALYTAARYFGPATDHAIEHTPGEAFFYSSLFLKPSTDQRKALRDLLARFPSAGTPEESGRALDDLLSDAFEDLDLSYTQDIKPWLGTEIAFWAAPPNEGRGDFGWALMIATDDEEAAGKAVVKSSVIHDGSKSDPFTIDGPNAFIEDGFVNLMNVSAQGPWKRMHGDGAVPPLAESKRFNDATALLPQDRVALAYFDPVPLFDGIPSGQVARVVESALGPYATEPQSAVAYLRHDAIVFESTSPHSLEGHGGSPDPQRGLLEEVPKVSWGAAGVEDLGEVIRTIANGFAAGDFGVLGFGALREVFRQETGLDLDADLLDWMGDVGLFIMGGDGPVNGGAIIESTDPDKSLQSLRKIGGILRSRGTPVQFLDGHLAGFALRIPGVADPLYAVSDPANPDRVVVAVGRGPFDRWLETAGMADSEVFRDARSDLGEGYAAGFYLSPQKILEVMRAAGFDQDATFEKDVAPNLEVLTHIVGGSRVDGDTVYRRLVIGVK